jgi:hypothetical protein
MVSNLRHARLTTPQQRKEGDLIIGRKNLSAIGTLVERTTNYTMLLHLPHTATPPSWVGRHGPAQYTSDDRRLLAA